MGRGIHLDADNAGDAVQVDPVQVKTLQESAQGRAYTDTDSREADAMRKLTWRYVLATAPVLLGGGTPFFTALDNWVNLNLVQTRTFPDGVVLTRCETRR